MISPAKRGTVCSLSLWYDGTISQYNANMLYRELDRCWAASELQLEPRASFIVEYAKIIRLDTEELENIYSTSKTCLQ